MVPDPEPFLWLVFTGDQYYPQAGMGDCRYCGPDESEAMTLATGSRADWVEVYALHKEGGYYSTYYRWGDA